jgi:hypothetical protein
MRPRTREYVDSPALPGCRTNSNINRPDRPRKSRSQGIDMNSGFKLAACGFLLLIAGSFQPSNAEDLKSYAKRCDDAIGPTVTGFNCELGTQVPTTHYVTTAPYGSTNCDEPNRLNEACDPGSKFTVLVNTADAYVVAHCRKKGFNLNEFGDIAVIQHNKKTGATCFYQSDVVEPGIGVRLDGHVKAPSEGEAAWRWKSPSAAAGVNCVKCHDNGPLIRSPYLAQIKSGKDALPGAGDTTFNSVTQPYFFIGENFASWKVYRVEVAGNYCISCHRLGVSNLSSGVAGTALDFGIRATSAQEAHKNVPYSKESQIWMPPEGVYFDANYAQLAQQIHDCGARASENPMPNAPDCRIVEYTRADGDKDGIPDEMDNCPAISNTDQHNIDGDALGDACDPDDDNDGCTDVEDQHPQDAVVRIGTRSPGPGCKSKARSPVFGNEGVDSDHDGLPNCRDPDDDNDQVIDDDDACSTRPGTDALSCLLIDDCPVETPWEVCVGGGCVQFLLRALYAVDPQSPPVDIVTFENFWIDHGAIFIAPPVERQATGVKDIIAQLSAPPRQAGKIRLEIWSRGTSGAPLERRALVAEYNPAEVTLGQNLALASVRIVPSAAGGMPLIESSTARAPAQPPPEGDRALYVLAGLALLFIALAVWARVLRK